MKLRLMVVFCKANNKKRMCVNVTTTVNYFYVHIYIRSTALKFANAVTT